MTYHIKTNNGMRVHLVLDPKQQFPEKVYEVANDGFLIQWNDSGTGVILCQEQHFEKHVMKCYPGFVKIPNYANIRRLFREYGFDWTLYGDDSIEFRHPFLIRGKPNLLSEVKTRRKSLSSPSLRKAKEHIPVPREKKATKLDRRCRKRPVSIPEETESSDDCSLSAGSSIIKPTRPRSECMVRKKPDLDSILNVYAKNELSEEELLDLVYKKSYQADVNDSGPKSGYEWLYSYPLSDDVNGMHNLEYSFKHYQHLLSCPPDARQDWDYGWYGNPSPTTIQEHYFNGTSHAQPDSPEFEQCVSPKIYEELMSVQFCLTPSKETQTDFIEDVMLNYEPIPLDHGGSGDTQQKAVCCDCHCHKEQRYMTL